MDSKQLGYRPGVIYSGFPSSLGYGVGGQSYSNFLASTVYYPTWAPRKVPMSLLRA